MPGLPLDPASRAKVVRYLLLGWRPDAIAKEVHCHPVTIYRIEHCLWIRGSVKKPHCHAIGHPRSLTLANEDTLLQYLNRHPTAVQHEMAWFLWEECGIHVNQSTISRVLKRRKWSKKQARRMAQNLSLDLRRGFLSEMTGIRAEQMVFLDESLFNETTGWRLTAWAPIGQAARYTGNRTRGHSWSLLAAYTTGGYLPCWTVKEGYFNAESFYRWLVDELLPHCQPYPGPNSVIIMDNASSHCNQSIADAITQRGCLSRYLPPYSPDFSPIELSFSVLKAWVRRHFDETWPSFDGTFGQFLTMAVQRSHCDRFAVAHFRYSGNGGYVFEGDMEAFNEKVRAFERGKCDVLDF